MFNTYGLHAINKRTFNQMCNGTIVKDLRDEVVTAIRINNAVFNIAGYVPQTRFVSGCARMAVWLVVLGAVLAIGERDTLGKGHIIGRWYDEAIDMAFAQISRGALVAFAPNAWKINAALDVIATPLNFHKTVSLKERPCRCSYSDSCKASPHNEPSYPLLFSPLYLA